MRDVAWQILAGLLVLLLVFAVGYATGKSTVSGQLDRLRGQLIQQKAQAQAELDRLTAERDERQARLDQLATEQERKDAQAETEIARLADELERRPVRVRIVPGGDCSGAAQDRAAEDPRGGTEHPGQAYGVLPAENHRRLSAALSEVERLSAAYTSCRATLFQWQSVIFR